MINRGLYFIVIIIILLLLLLLGALYFVYESSSSRNFNSFHGEYSDFVKYLEIRKAEKLAKIEFERLLELHQDEVIVFLGDSITYRLDNEEYFGFVKTHNEGVMGDTTSGVISRIDSVIEYKPSKVFLLIGINDIGKQKDPVKISDNIDEIIKALSIKIPNAKIFVESVYPIRTTIAGFDEISPINHENNTDVMELNNFIKKIAEKYGVIYINIYPHLLDDNDELDVEYTTDCLHINEVGYDVISEVLMDYVKEIYLH